jgi:hypothetical protein
MINRKKNRMDSKKDLAKIALTALILASATPVNGQVDNSIEAHGILLAAGCAAHGCPAAKNSSADRNTRTPPSTGGVYENDSSNISYAYSPPSSYNTQQSGTTSPVYVEDYRGVTYDSTPHPTPEYGGLTSFNHEYLTTTDYDFNRAAVTTSTSTATLTEAQLLGMLTSQGRAIYLNLDPEGKALAIQLASQDSYRDKNLAVKEAQRRMNERRGLLNR